MVSHVRPQEEAEERLWKKKFFTPTGAKDGEGEGHGGGPCTLGGQEAESRSPGTLRRGSLWVSVGKAQQGERFRTGWFKWPQWALGCRHGCSLAMPGTGRMEQRGIAASGGAGQRGEV